MYKSLNILPRSGNRPELSLGMYVSRLKKILKYKSLKQKTVAFIATYSQ